jgi:transposase-like protein
VRLYRSVFTVIPKGRVKEFAARIVEEGGKETLVYYDFPSQHWRSLQANNSLERHLWEIRRRTRFVGAFPGG